MDKEITKKLEDGIKSTLTSENYARYLSFMNTFHEYSFNNCMLIWLQCPEATLVAGYKAWQNKKRQVKKGEKGIKILAPCPKKFTTKKTNEDGKEEEKEVEYVDFRTVSVFDVSQTEGEPIPELAHQLNKDVSNFKDLFSKLEAVSPVPISFNDIDTNGVFSSTNNCITIKNGLSEEQTIKTTIHEIAHAILHNPNGEEKEADRRTKEVQAESIAYIVCDYLGIDSSDYSFGYIAGWCNGDLKLVSQNMEVIRKTANTIKEAIA